MKHELLVKVRDDQTKFNNITIVKNRFSFCDVIRGMPRVSKELIIVGRNPIAKLISVEDKIQAKLEVWNVKDEQKKSKFYEKVEGWNNLDQCNIDCQSWSWNWSPPEKPCDHTVILSMWLHQRVQISSRKGAGLLIGRNGNLYAAA